MSVVQHSALGVIGSLALIAGGIAGCEGPVAPSAESSSDASASHTPATANAMSQNYRADLQPLGNSGVHGTANFQLKGNRLSVQLMARGLTPGREHGQHIHMRASCEDFGPVQIPLDFDLAETDDGFGGPFPSTSGMSETLTYSQKASSEEFSGLALGKKTVVVHAGTPATNPSPVACGEINPVGHGN